AQHAGKQGALLIFGAVLDDRGCDVREAQRIERSRRARAVHLLREHDLLHEPRAPAAPLLRPRDRGVARVGERTVPRAQPFDGLATEVHRPTRTGARVVGEVRVEPGSELRAERLGFRRIVEVHSYGRARCARRSVTRDGMEPGRMLAPLAAVPLPAVYSLSPPRASCASISAWRATFSACSSSVVCTCPSTFSSPITW